MDKCFEVLMQAPAYVEYEMLLRGLFTFGGKLIDIKIEQTIDGELYTLKIEINSMFKQGFENFTGFELNELIPVLL